MLYAKYYLFTPTRVINNIYRTVRCQDRHTSIRKDKQKESSKEKEKV